MDNIKNSPKNDNKVTIEIIKNKDSNKKNQLCSTLNRILSKTKLNTNTENSTEN